MIEPRPPKRVRTRRRLLDAGLRVLAAKGDAFTASDVVVAADVSNGTFYNHFTDRDEFIRALARESLAALADRSAEETQGTDPAWRFALASTRVLETAVREPVWGRAVLRLADHATPPHATVQRHLRFDLADGHRTGRFIHGDDPVTVDLVTGTLLAAVRRVVSAGDTPADTSLIADVVARLLEVIGIDRGEARTIAVAALDAERSPGQLTGVAVD